jgi:flagella basal body P-ring formation protein FlgA
MNSQLARFSLSTLLLCANTPILLAASSEDALNAQSHAQFSGSHANLSDEVHELLSKRAKARYPTADVTVRTLALDPRLRLAPCETLELVPRGDNLYGRVPVAVRCLAPQPWSVFLTGDVDVTLPVAVASRSLPRGTKIGPGDLILEAKNLARLRNQYLTDIDAAVGMEIRSPLQPNSAIYASMLKHPLAVRRGERVTILAQRGSVAIRAHGEALQDGITGAQIRVKNRQSERTVHAWVQGPGLVATTP